MIEGNCGRVVVVLVLRLGVRAASTRERVDHTGAIGGLLMQRRLTEMPAANEDTESNRATEDDQGQGSG